MASKRPCHLPESSLYWMQRAPDYPNDISVKPDAHENKLSLLLKVHQQRTVLN